MQGILMTIFLLSSITGLGVVKIVTSFLKVCLVAGIRAFSIAVKHVILLTSRFYFFEALIILLLVAGVYSFCFLVLFCLYSLIFLFLSFLFCFVGFAALMQVDFDFLALSSLKQEFFTVIPWVWTFKVVLLKRQWLLN